MEKPSFFIIDFEVSYEVLYVTNSFDLHTIHFSKRKKYRNLTFDNTFKSAVLQCAKLNSSSINKPYLRAVEYAISLFSNS